MKNNGKFPWVLMHFDGHNSHKSYHVYMDAQEVTRGVFRFIVKSNYGPRHAPNRASGPELDCGHSREAAELAFDKLVQSKLKKGYVLANSLNADDVMGISLNRRAKLKTIKVGEAKYEEMIESLGGWTAW